MSITTSVAGELLRLDVAAERTEIRNGDCPE
jgi:hypothetical protein